MTAPAAYPRKLFYKIQEVANIVGVEPYVLRYWETRFPMLAPEKDAADQRRYRQKDIELLLRIRQLLHVEKYTIAGAVEKLKDEAGPVGRRQPSAPAEDAAGDLFGDALPAEADTATPAFEDSGDGFTDDQRQRLRRVKDELGILRRELEEWRDELA